MSNLVVAIHQPDHMPWLGYFNKMIQSDVFVIMDKVQFKKNNYQNRNRILGTNGPQWITVPVEMKNHMTTDIKDMHIASDEQHKWRRKYLKTLEESYKKCPFFKEMFGELVEIFEAEPDKLCDLNIRIIKYFAERLDIRPKFIRLSEMSVSGSKSDLVLNICKALNARIYVAGSGSRHYMNLLSFEENEIKVMFNDYEHPVYPQKRVRGIDAFVPYMSILDMLMCNDPEESKRILLI